MRTFAISLCLVAAAGTAYLTATRQRTEAANSDNSTWGATDPTWSPDGKKLAFSVFGSIWQVPAEGGVAEQITNSPGYHALPAWSPRGDRVAFVNGNVPAGRLPAISGNIVIVELASGAEHPLATPHPTAGTLAWSPDATRLVCGLRSPNAGALLFEIPVDGGDARQLQVVPIRTKEVGGWVDASWNPRRPEIFFATSRSGAPQIWTLMTGRPLIQVQLPLTHYRREDIVALQGVSALPDGTGAVYSAALVNRKKSYELYRTGANGQSTPITATGRDEFSPAVSPDGKLVAHVSNELGNIDIFTVPVAGGPKRHVRITDLRFRKPSGRVRVRILDERGQPTPARLFVRASDGKGYCPAGSAIFYLPIDSHPPREAFFLASGDDTFPSPAGSLRLIAVKGIEYDVSERTVEVPPGETAEITVQLRRWANWYGRGWHTGDNHFHANYGGSYYQRPPDSLRWLQAEDLNVANMMVANAEGAFVHDKEFFTGAVNPLSGPRYVLYWGQEYRNEAVMGHMIFANLKKQVPPSYTSVLGSDSPYDFPLNTTAALEAKKQGGFVAYTHPHYAGYPDVFDTYLGAKELPVSAAYGAVDSIDILPTGEAAYQVWYAVLNSGFKISAGAGTDCFTNYRGIFRVPGAGRIYIDVGPTLTWDRWLARYREGRTFVTNGPLLTFSVNGQPAGTDIRVPGGQPLHVSLSAEAISNAPLRRLEFVQNGKAIAVKEAANGERTLRLDQDVTVAASCWFAVRATGDPMRGNGGGDGVSRAHSSPVYVTVNGAPALVRSDLELMIRWIDRLWALFEERNNYGSPRNRDEVRKMLDTARSKYVEKLKIAAGGG